MRTQTSVNNTVNDLRYEIKFENCVKDKITFLLSKTSLFCLEQKYILFSDIYFFKIPKNLIIYIMHFAGKSSRPIYERFQQQLLASFSKALGNMF